MRQPSAAPQLRCAVGSFATEAVFAVAWSARPGGNVDVPVVARFEGIKIKFYHDEHPPSHFHASYAESEAQIDLQTLDVIKGDLPRPQLRRVREWAETRRNELLSAWITCQSDGDPGTID